MSHPQIIICTFFLSLLSCSMLNAQRSQELSTADKAFKVKDYYTAFEYYDRAFNSSSSKRKGDGKEMAAMYRFAEAARITYHYEKAEEAYQQVAGSNFVDKYPMLPYYYATTLKDNGNYDGAEAEFGEFLKITATSKEMEELQVYAKQYKQSCAVAKELMKFRDERFTIIDMKNINTKYSDFSPHEIGDSLYYSSLKFDRQRRVRTGKNQTAEDFLVGKILFSEKKGEERGAVDHALTERYVNTGNSTASPNEDYMIFTKCQVVDLTKFQCKLYISYRDEKKNQWSEPELLETPINHDKYTTTHPEIAFDPQVGSEVLYFVSDRPGGEGKLDIWKADILNIKEKKFGKPENLGKPINTMDDDVTPFFYERDQVLFFSSSWHSGLGGFDIFQSKRVGGAWQEPENVGVPLNSAANDLYFLINADDTTGYFASNRPGSKVLMGESCCNDIYRFHVPPPPDPNQIDIPDTIDTDTIPLAVIDPDPEIPDNINVPDPEPDPEPIKEPTIDGEPLKIDIAEFDTDDSESTLTKLNELLPISLYFHNDRPDPRSYKSTTKTTYAESYDEYVSLEQTYVEKHSSQFEGDVETMTASQQKVTAFFDSQVKGEYQRMNACFDLLLELLQKGNKLSIQIRGYTSKRAKSSYNKILAQRRIGSIQNQLKTYNEGAFLEFFENGQFSIEELPLGDTKAAQSDAGDMDDPRNSIYGVEAAMERRIEIQMVQKQ